MRGIRRELDGAGAVLLGAQVQLVRPGGDGVIGCGRRGGARVHGIRVGGNDQVQEGGLQVREHGHEHLRDAPLGPGGQIARGDLHLVQKRALAGIPEHFPGMRKPTHHDQLVVRGHVQARKQTGTANPRSLLLRGNRAAGPCGRNAGSRGFGSPRGRRP